VLVHWHLGKKADTAAGGGCPVRVLCQDMKSFQRAERKSGFSLWHGSCSIIRIRRKPTPLAFRESATQPHRGLVPARAVVTMLHISEHLSIPQRVSHYGHPIRADGYPGGGPFGGAILCAVLGAAGPSAQPSSCHGRRAHCERPDTCASGSFSVSAATFWNGSASADSGRRCNPADVILITVSSIGTS